MESNTIIKSQLQEVQKQARIFSEAALADRNNLLLIFAEYLVTYSDQILNANKIDLQQSLTCLPESLLSRLKLDSQKISQIADGIIRVAALPDPLQKTNLKRQLDQNLILEQRTVPLGVIAFVFESRPDVLPQVAALCIKTGNGLVFKGGAEAINTLTCIYALLKKTFAKYQEHYSPPFLHLESREAFQAVLKHPEHVDLVVPRGSNALVHNIMQSSKIPVLGHADGVCHIYVESFKEQAEAIEIVLDSKTQYPAACNSVEVILINASIAASFIPELVAALHKYGVQVFGCSRTLDLVDHISLFTGEDWHVEYSDLTIAIKIVDSDIEAIEHINRFGSHHTDAILSTEPTQQKLFCSQVDSADVFVNCSTRFADGYRYGLGAEVGISTSKLHARGPVGIEGLCTYKYILSGDGHQVADYVSGKRQFKHKDL